MLTDKKLSIVRVFLLLFAINLVAYFNAFHSDKRYDCPTLYKPAHISDFGDRVKYAFLIKGEYGAAGEQPLAWFRPLPFLISWQLYRIADGQMMFINFANIVLLSITGFILFQLLHTLFGRPRIALWAAILFCVHPVTGIQINYHPGTVHCLTAFGLMMLSLQAFVSYFRDGARVGQYVFSLFLFAIALLFHEIALFLPFYMAWTVHQLEFKNCKRGYFLLAAYVVTLFAYLKVRSMALGQGDVIIERLIDLGVDPVIYLGTLVKVFFISLGKLITMDGIVINWCLPFLSGNPSLWLLAGVFLAAFFIFLMRSRKNSIVVWSLGALLVGFIPVCVGGLFEPEMGLLYEAHWMFFKYVGFFMLIACGIDHIRTKSRWLGWAVFVLTVAVYIIAGWQYNKLYADELAYAKFYVEHAPGFKTSRHYLARAYIKNENYPQAREVLKNILTEDRDDSTAYLLLAEIDVLEGDYTQAETNIINGFSFDPMHPHKYLWLGRIYEKEGDRLKAVEAYSRALQLDPAFAEARSRLEGVYRSQEKGKPLSESEILNQN